MAWHDISGAQVIVETSIGERYVEPSQGTHFFRNITARHVGYVTVGARDLLDRDWLEDLAASHAAPERGAVRHIELREPLAVFLDGRKGHAAVLKSARSIEPGGTR